MKAFGTLLFVIGAILVFGAFGSEATVSSSPTYIGGEAIGGGSTYNLGLLQHQMMLLHTGLGLLIAGAVFISGPVGLRERTASTDRSREGETEVEAEIRRAGVRRTNIVVGCCLAAVVLLLVVVSFR